MELTVTKTYMTGRGRHGTYRVNHYATQTEDGTRFTNSSLAEMRRVIARKYGITQRSIVFTIREDDGK